MKNRKGYEFDILRMLPIFLILAVTFYLAYTIGSAVDTELTAMGDISTAPMEATLDAIPLFDYFIPILYAITLISSIVLAFYIDVNPIWYIVSIFAWILTLVYSAILSNVHYSIATQAELTAASSLFTYTVYFMNNLPIFALVGGLLIAIATYMKWRAI